jgi:hypothetical protein
VTFEPGARTAWHTHPLGQTLIITAGAGRVQRDGGPVEEIRPGDVVWSVAALIAQYRINEMPFHLKFALENGVSREELIEAITHLAFYAGWPTASTAIGITRRVFEEQGK